MRVARNRRVYDDLSDLNIVNIVPRVQFSLTLFATYFYFLSSTDLVSRENQKIVKYPYSPFTFLWKER